MKTFKKLLLAGITLLGCQAASAQYADGTGTGSMQKQIFWLSWGSGVTPSISDQINNGTYTWYISPTIKVEAIISNVSGESYDGHTVTMAKYNTGDWVDDGLQLLYPGTNPIGMATSLDGGATPASVGNHTVTFDIQYKLYIKTSGVWTSVAYPGIVIGDAESLASSSNEHITATTNAAVAWQLIDFRNDASSATVAEGYKLDVSNSGKSFKLYMESGGDIKAQAVMFARNATKLTNVQMKGGGITALATGFVVPFDFGDAPASYGDAGNYINDFSYVDGTVSGNGTYTPYLMTKSVLVPSAKVYIGPHDVDADGNPPHSIDANADGVDDSAAVFPTQIKVNQSGAVVVKAFTTNTANTAATLYVWIDFNRDGRFAANELQTVTVPALTTNVERTLTFPQSTFGSVINAGITYARLRISTYPMTDDAATAGVDERSFTALGDGETEDYRYDISGITISGRVFDDANGLVNGVVDGSSGVGTVSGAPLYAYLLDAAADTVISKVAVDAAGNYSFIQSANNGSYKVAISTVSAAIGAARSTIPPNLPAAWLATGEDYGTNNIVGSGVKAGAPSLVIGVSTPGTSQDVSGVNFGIQQRPVSPSANHTIATPLGNTSLQLRTSNGMSALRGSDPEDMSTTNFLQGKNVRITDTAGMNGNHLYYNNVLLVPGSVISNYDSTKLTIKFTGTASSSAQFRFSYQDAAGAIASTPATYRISWGTALPLSLVSFDLEKSTEGIALHWVTADEHTSGGFHIVRSSDGSNWQTIASVAATGGTGGTYDYLDKTLWNGTVYYRLQLLETDGSYTWSPTRKIEWNGTAEAAIEAYPNPVSNLLHLRLTTQTGIRATSVYDIHGKLVYHSEGKIMEDIDLSSQADGPYFIWVEQQDGSILRHKAEKISGK